MPFIIADRVRESSTTTGTGNIALGGAVVGYQTFDAVLDTADTTFYVFADQAGGPNWEVGIGTFTAPSTLARTTVLSSSNGGSLVNFTAGTKDVFISLPTSKTNVEDQPNLIEVNSSSAALRITQTGAGNALLVEDSANPDSSPFVVDASGNVGVGTTTPTAPLDVNGNVAITGTARRITGDFSNATIANRIYFQTATAGGGTSVAAIPNATGANSAFNAFGSPDPGNSSLLQLRAGSDTGDVRLTSGATGTGTLLPMTFFTGGSERMRIDNAGNVGIGTSSPAGRLHARFDAGAGDGFTGRYIFQTTDQRLTIGTYWQAGVGQNARIQSSTDAGVAQSLLLNPDGGNVGIGVSSATARLHVAGTIQSTSGSSAAQIYSDGGAAYFASSGAFPSLFLTNGSERMRIDASGNVGIGATTVRAQQHIFGAGQNTAALTDAGNRGGMLRVSDNSSSGGAGGAVLFANVQGDGVNSVGFAAIKGLLVDGSNNTAGDLAFSTRSSTAATALTERMRITFDGNVGVGTSGPSTRLTVAVGASDSTNGILVSGGAVNKTVMLRPSMGAGSNNNIVQTGDGGIIFDGGAIDTGAFVIAPWATATSGIRIVGSTGNVGIGTASPTQRLTVSGQITSSVAGASILQTAIDTTNSINWQVGSDGSNIYAGTQTNHSLRIVTNNSERMRVASNSPDVAIGIASFYYQSANRSTLTVAGATDALVAIGGGGVASGYLYGTSTILNVTADNKTLQLNASGANVIQSITNGVERFRVGPSGQFGIGGANYGTAGQVLTSNGAAAAPSWQNAAANGLLLNVQVFTSSGTYTRTAGVTRAVVIAVGGGGGGGGSNVGTGGTGGTTSFGSHVTAVGGSGGGPVWGAPGNGGTGGTGATIAIRGAPGGMAGGYNVINSNMFSGPGGGEGGGNSVAFPSANAGNVGIAGVRGGGGSGGGFRTSTCGGSDPRGGAGGGQGEIAIDYITSVGATETVTIGAGGTGGSGADRNGGAGGAGYVIVYEYS